MYHGDRRSALVDSGYSLKRSFFTASDVSLIHSPFCLIPNTETTDPVYSAVACARSNVRVCAKIHSAGEPWLTPTYDLLRCHGWMRTWQEATWPWGRNALYCGT